MFVQWCHLCLSQTRRGWFSVNISLFWFYLLSCYCRSNYYTVGHYLFHKPFLCCFTIEQTRNIFIKSFIAYVKALAECDLSLYKRDIYFQISQNDTYNNYWELCLNIKFTIFQSFILPQTTTATDNQHLSVCKDVRNTYICILSGFFSSHLLNVP